LPTIRAPAVDTIAGAVRIDAKPKLGGNHYLIAARRERFSDQYFVAERTIRLSSVKQCDAALDSGANDFDASSRSIGGPEAVLRPMQPQPKAETSRPFLPNLRFCIVSR
jgi:hypothetical protein